MNPTPGLVIGSLPNHWVFHPTSAGDRANDLLDLARSSSHAPPSPSATVRLKTTAEDISVSPAKTALVIVDMQNFFLSPALGRDPDGAGVRAMHALLDRAIPACRKAGIRVVWLNWGLMDREIEEMPPSLLRSFGALNGHKRTEGVYRIPSGAAGASSTSSVTDFVSSASKPVRVYGGLGRSLDSVTLEDGSTQDAGQMLFRDQWNTDLPLPLKAAYEEGQALKERPDVWIHKNRLSGMWGASTAATEFFEKEGIATLLFCGVNTDQCVGGTLQDAVSKGFDCVLINDCCGTTSPEACKEMVEYNSAKVWGFLIDSKELSRGVDGMIEARA